MTLLHQYARNCAEVINTVLSQQDNKIIALIVGVPGGGKSTFANQIATFSAKYDAEILSLDRFRLQCNDGKYPDQSQHAEISKLAASEYSKALKDARSRLLILDNTHLRWTHWSGALGKAMSENYHLFPVNPPHSLASIWENRSEHVATTAKHRQMLHLWPGHRFGEFMNKVIPPSIVRELVPLKKDPIVNENNGSYVEWGDGFLYVLHGYLGFSGRSMAEAVIRGGHLMSKNGAGAYFMRKDGMIHLTLVQPRSLENSASLGKIAKMLSKIPSPGLEFSGVGTVTSGADQTWFLTLTDESYNRVKNALADAISKAGVNMSGPVDHDGFHVTIGHRAGDIYHIDKRVQPIWRFDQSDCMDLMVFPVIEGIVSPQEWSERRPVGSSLLRKLIANFPEYKDVRFGDVPETQLRNMDWACNDPLLRVKFRRAPFESPNGGSYLLLSVRVESGGGKSDDEVYKDNQKIQQLVPRGLCYCLKLDRDNRLHWLGNVHPTPKFTGDFDDDDEVTMISTEELERASSGSLFIVTEKANGEMFSVSVLECFDDGRYLMVLGSKNNKFAFIFDPMTTEPSEQLRTVGDYQRSFGDNEFPGKYLQNDRRWIMQNMWVEMCLEFFEQLSKTGHARNFCHHLFENKLTACAEFESYLHQHIEAFPFGHRVFKFFALTGYDSNGNHRVFSAKEWIGHLNWLRGIGMQTVAFHEETSASVQSIRADLLQLEGKEGAVLLVLDPIDEHIKTMIKMKSIWYVMHRGLRERTRTILSRLKKGGSKKKDGMNLISLQYVEREFENKIKEKLDMLKLDLEGAQAQHWRQYGKAYAAYLVQHARDDLAAFEERFSYEYPSIVADVVANSSE